MIQFEPGEVVEGPESGLGTGDAKGWTIGAKGNWFMLKAQERNPDTNLLVVTNRRRYVFGLETAGKADTPTWALSFDYPDTRAKAAREAKEKADRVKAMSNADGDLADRRNEDFDMKGDLSIAPTALWDDGRFTYFQYDTTRQTPEIFRVQADGSEATTNRHVEGDTIVVEHLAPGFMLRLGKAVLAIRNNGYNPDGTFNRTGTTTPGWVRMTKGGAHD